LVRSALILFVVFSLLSCDHKNADLDKGKELTLDKEIVYTYLFLGHIYDKKPIIDKRISKKMLDRFDQVWLGGDLTDDSSVDWKLEYLDSIFNIKSNTTHWAFGNHDIRSGRELVLNFVGKPSHYAVYINGLTLIVFDSNYNDSGECDSVNVQTEFIKMVCDTIKYSSHLVLMSHHVPWGKIEDIDALSFANTSIENRIFQCDTAGYFHNIIYPELVKVKNRNIQVVSLAGDLGQKQSTFEYKTKEGVNFLGNGSLSTNEYNKIFKKDTENDSVLIFFHNPKKKELIWKFANVGKN
jgi:predicted phosphodiesterase